MPFLVSFVITAPFSVRVVVLCPFPAVAVHGAIQVRISEENSATVAGSVDAMACLMSAGSFLLFPHWRVICINPSADEKPLASLSLSRICLSQTHGSGIKQ